MLQSFKTISKQYSDGLLTEARADPTKNIHLNHLEDSPFLGDGIDSSVDFLDSLMGMLSGSNTSSLTLSTKFDGAPAIVAGIDPESGRFFIGTKSVFNKKNPKIAFSTKDIIQQYGENPVLSSILTRAFVALKDIPMKGVLQGDVLFTPEMLQDKMIAGEPHLTFKPNTLTYAFPKDSEQAQKIRKSDIGIVWHTSYKGKSLSDMVASFEVNLTPFKNSKVWTTNPYISDVSENARLSKEERKDMIKDFSNVDILRTMIDTNALNQIAENPTMQKIILSYTNKKFREDGKDIEDPNEHFDGLIFFTNQFFENLKQEIKTDAGKNRKDLECESVRNFFFENRETLLATFELQKTFIAMKRKILNKLANIQNTGTFIKDENGYRVAEPEGFVAIGQDGKAIKLVDRISFSRNNNVERDWVSGDDKKNPEAKKPVKKPGIVVTFGRFSPPTIGHRKLIHKVLSAAGDTKEHRVYASQSYDPLRNPIPYAQKISVMKKMFPGVNIVKDESITNPFVLLDQLKREGYEDVVFVVGSDRMDEFSKKLGLYAKNNGINGIAFESAGKRNRDGDEEEAMSGTDMRTAVMNGDFSTFSAGLPDTLSPKDKEALFSSMQKNMAPLGMGDGEPSGGDEGEEKMRDRHEITKLQNRYDGSSSSQEKKTVGTALTQKKAEYKTRWGVRFKSEDLLNG